MNNDFIEQLISILDLDEKKQLTKYLKIYDGKNYDNTPYLIYKRYLQAGKFNEKDFLKKTNCKSIGHFRKEKSILKYRILDYLSIFRKQEDSFSMIREKIDYASQLRNLGESFWIDALAHLRRAIEISENEHANHYTIIVFEEAATMYHKLLKTNLNDIIYFTQAQENASKNIQLELELFDFYTNVVQFAAQAFYVKTKSLEDNYKSIKLDPFYSLAIDKVDGNAQKFVLLLTLSHIHSFEKDQEKCRLVALQFEELFNSFPEEAHYNSFSFKQSYYQIQAQNLVVARMIHKLDQHLALFKKFLESVSTKNENQSYLWFRYYNFVVIKNILQNRFYEEDEHNLNNIIESSKLEVIPKLTLYTQFNLVKFYLHKKDILKAEIHCNKILHADNIDNFSLDIVNITKLVQLACIFKLMIQENSFFDRMQEIESLAATYYRHFRSLEKEYYQFEIKFCSFFKTLSIKKNKNLKKELIKFRRSIEEINRNDKFKFLSKLAHHYFDFFKWLDDCIATVK